MVIAVQNQGNRLLTESAFSVEFWVAGIASTSVLPSLPDA